MKMDTPLEAVDKTEYLEAPASLDVAALRISVLSGISHYNELQAATDIPDGNSLEGL